MYISRQFNLIGGKIDFQYVSSIEFKNGKMFLGYDSKVCYAKDLTNWEVKRVSNYLDQCDCKYTVIEGELYEQA